MRDVQPREALRLGLLDQLRQGFDTDAELFQIKGLVIGVAIILIVFEVLSYDESTETIDDSD